MEVILKQTIDNLGREGDIVNVKPGYARNYLLPQKMATVINKMSLALLKQEQDAIQARLARQQKETEALVAQLSGITVEITRRVGDENRLFGSVTASDITNQLKEKGISIDRRSIVLSDPIKMVGESTVAIKVGYQMMAEIKVQVVPENIDDAA